MFTLLLVFAIDFLLILYDFVSAQIEYYSCSICDDMVTTSRDVVTQHCVDKHSTIMASADTGGRCCFVVSSVYVSHHGGRYRCPFVGCAVRMRHIIALQEHCVEQHGRPLSDAQRLDFFDAQRAAPGVVVGGARSSALGVVDGTLSTGSG